MTTRVLLLILLRLIPIPLLLFTSAVFGQSVCQFPQLDDWLRCQRNSPSAAAREEGEAAQQQNALLNGWFCDPESTMSNSEVTALDDSVRQLYAQQSSTCVCAGELGGDGDEKEQQQQEEEEGKESEQEEKEKEEQNEGGHCWFRFAFAFVRDLRPVPDVLTADQCNSENIITGLNKPRPKFTSFVHNFASILRQRWALGQCGEELLLLVIQRPDEMQGGGRLPPASALAQSRQSPLVLVSAGQMVLQRLGPLLDQLEDNANAQLEEEGLPLHRVLAIFITKIGRALTDGGQPSHQRQYPPVRSHVPLWAWSVFAACGIACALMALGLFLIQRGNRRPNGPGGKQQGQGMPRRHWKDGAEEGQPPSQTYMNLVHLLMPHPKIPPVNLPQPV